MTPSTPSADHLCEHLEPIRLYLLARGARQHTIAKIWSGGNNFAVFHEVIDTAAVRRAVTVPGCVIDHAHRGTHDGHEAGFSCEACKDGIVGPHPQAAAEGTKPIG